MALFVMPMKATERLSTLKRVTRPHAVLYSPSLCTAIQLSTNMLNSSTMRTVTELVCGRVACTQAQLQVVTWGDSQRPWVLLRGDTLPGALFNFETALKVDTHATDAAVLRAFAPAQVSL
jgi:hypothetical protein